LLEEDYWYFVKCCVCVCTWLWRTN